MEKIISSDIAGWLLAGLLVVNAVLSVAAKAFEAIGKSDKLPGWLAKASAIVAKLLDVVSANRKH